MRFEPSPVCKIKREDTFRDGVLQHVIATQRIQRTRIYYGIPSDNNSAQVQVETRFANPSDGNPTLHHDLTLVDASGTREGQPPLSRQRELLTRSAEEIIQCQSCTLFMRSQCGLDSMIVDAVGTDIRYDTSAQKIIGLKYAKELRAGTQASDVKCIQP